MIEIPRVGVGVVVIKENKILLGKRKGAHGEGCWSFPGGHLEYGESIELCAARELKEETNITALMVQPGPWTNDIIEGKHYVTLFAFVDSFDGEAELLEPHKCEKWLWFDWNRLPRPLFQPIESLLKKTGLTNFILKNTKPSR